MSTLKYWLWLASLPGFGPVTAGTVLRFFGSPERAWSADESEYRLIDGLGKPERAALLDKGMERAEKILSDCERLSISILSQQDALYPQRLLSVDNPPLVLYYRGRFPQFDNEVAVGVVGTRSASAYGLSCAKKFGFQIGKYGGLVVSGLAAGIDSAAAEGALSAGAKTVAVLGCGVDVVYPRSSARLYEDVAAAGALISEYPPGTRPAASNFPTRNRIISGLSLGVLVVEAPLKSGALITAACALEQGRDVFAVPGSIDSPASAGSNRLLREGAVCVLDGWDVMEEYAALFPDSVTPRSDAATLAGAYESSVPMSGKSARSAPESPAVEAENDKKVIDKSENRAYIDLHDAADQLSPDELSVSSVLADGPRHVDEIIESTQLPASRVLAALTMLEVQGFAVQLPGRRFSLAEAEDD